MWFEKAWFRLLVSQCRTYMDHGLCDSKGYLSSCLFNCCDFAGWLMKYKILRCSNLYTSEYGTLFLMCPRGPWPHINIHEPPLMQPITYGSIDHAKSIWSTKRSLKIRVFLWLISKNVILTWDNLQKGVG